MIAEAATDAGLDAVKKSLAEYLKSFSESNAAPVEWCTSMFDDDGLAISNPPDLPIFEKLFHAPRVRFEAGGVFANPRTEEQRLSADAVRVILDSPVSERANARKPIDQYPGSLDVTITVAADYPLKTVRTIFVDTDSAEELGAVAETVAQGPDVTYNYYTTGPDEEEFSFESSLVDWTKPFREKRAGMFLFVVKDAADREWRVPFLEASWSKGGREFKSRVVN
ncbi:MAG: hypothetical protein ABR538_14845 [Candidatus Binatia bacterium]